MFAGLVLSHGGTIDIESFSRVLGIGAPTLRKWTREGAPFRKWLERVLRGCRGSLLHEAVCELVVRAIVQPESLSRDEREAVIDYLAGPGADYEVAPGCRLRDIYRGLAIVAQRETQELDDEYSGARAAIHSAAIAEPSDYADPDGYDW